QDALLSALSQRDDRCDGGNSDYNSQHRQEGAKPIRLHCRCCHTKRFDEPTSLINEWFWVHAEVVPLSLLRAKPRTIDFHSWPFEALIRDDPPVFEFYQALAARCYVVVVSNQDDGLAL